MNPYEDIINLPHPTSTKHPRMSMINRAAQFSPFAALSGYDAAIQETARLTDQRILLDDHTKAALDEKLRLLVEAINEQPEAAITYFLSDKKKTGGEYITIAGRVKRIDNIEREIVMTDRQIIPIDDILNITIS